MNEILGKMCSYLSHIDHRGKYLWIFKSVILPKGVSLLWMLQEWAWVKIMVQIGYAKNVIRVCARATHPPGLDRARSVIHGSCWGLTLGLGLVAHQPNLFLD